MPETDFLKKIHDRLRDRRRKRKRRGSLTLRILAVNAVAPLVLVVSILYMSQYRDNLIRAELETLKAQSQFFATAVSEGAIRPVQKGRPFLFAKPEEIEVLIPELSRRMVRRLGEASQSRTRLFSDRGTLIGDSHQLVGPDGIVQIVSLEAPESDFKVADILRYLGHQALRMLPQKTQLRRFPYTASDDVADYPDAALALNGAVSATAWQDDQGRLILTAAAPIQKVSQIMGVILVTREGRDIEAAMTQVRFDVFTVFLGSLSITIFLSLYLAGGIGRPLKKLARAAQAVSTGKGREIDIPDLTHRRDEIGELSEALRDMTHALWDRMDSIERFAADVAHEIKNPLTSVRSAVETAAVIKDQAKRDRLMEIVLHDVQRLDRLISDISNASRLDAELSRDEVTDIDMGVMLQRLVDAKRDPLERTGDGGEDESTQPSIVLLAEGTITVSGNEGRLAQVFENLLTNALSFSPPGGTVTINLGTTRDGVVVTVEDEGPGIPENKLDTIFERFYTERPSHEAYGSHSGLGLSIARQIVAAHSGILTAENIVDAGGVRKGARFTAFFPKA